MATEALADGSLTRRDLMRSYTKLHRNVYARTDVELTALDRAQAAWLWSGRRAILVGSSASALLGSRWIPADAPVELARARRPGAPGIKVRSGAIRDDEVCAVDCINCTTPARTAYDLGRRLPLEPPLFASTHCSMRRKRRSRKSSRSQSATREHVVVGSYVLLWISRTRVQSLRRRPACGCCSCDQDCRGP